MTAAPKSPGLSLSDNSTGSSFQPSIQAGRKAFSQKTYSNNNGSQQDKWKHIGLQLQAGMNLQYPGLQIRLWNCWIISLAIADPWFWCRAYNQIDSAASNIAIIDLTVLDFYFYTEWFMTQENSNNKNLDAHYLDLRSINNITKWRNHLSLKGAPIKALVFFLLQGIFNWPKLVIFNFEANMVLVLGQVNINEFQEHINWAQWDGVHLWNEISTAMGCRVNTMHLPRVLEANWIPVSNFLLSAFNIFFYHNIIAWGWVWAKVSLFCSINSIRSLELEKWALWISYHSRISWLWSHHQRTNLFSCLEILYYWIPSMEISKRGTFQLEPTTRLSSTGASNWCIPIALDQEGCPHIYWDSSAVQALFRRSKSFCVLWLWLSCWRIQLWHKLKHWWLLCY